MPPTFVCSHTKSGWEAAWVHVAGELDIATTPQLAQTLCDAEPHARLIALDLRDVTFMDCSGVHVIVDASRRACDVGRRLILLRGPPNVDRMFALTGHTSEVEIADVAPGDPTMQALRHSADADVPYEECDRPAARRGQRGDPLFDVEVRGGTESALMCGQLIDG